MFVNKYVPWINSCVSVRRDTDGWETWWFSLKQPYVSFPVAVTQRPTQDLAISWE